MKARKKKLCLSNYNIFIFHYNIPIPDFSFLILHFTFLILPPPRNPNIKIQRRIHSTIRVPISE